MQTGAYEQALRGKAAFKPMRHDSLNGLGGPAGYAGTAGLIALGLGAIMLRDKGIKFDNPYMTHGLVFLGGWVTGGAMGLW